MRADGRHRPHYYVGAHNPAWLAQSDVSLFVSHARLHERKRLPRARSSWALDSGGFTELSKNGSWRVGWTPRKYARAVRRYRDEIGQLDFASQQDWMCEPAVLKVTGLSVEEHQRRTVDNYLELMSIAPDLPWMPVLQGWVWGDHQDCAQLFERRGVRLAKLPRVGVGSICRRQGMLYTSLMIADLASEGLKLHGFGLKLQGVKSSGGHLASADSLSWSFGARREGKGEQNKLGTLLDWYENDVGKYLRRGFCTSTGWCFEHGEGPPNDQSPSYQPASHAGPHVVASRRAA